MANHTIHVQDGETPISVDISGGSTVSLVTTDFDKLELDVYNPLPVPLKLRTYQTPSARVDIDNNNLQVLSNSEYYHGNNNDNRSDEEGVYVNEQILEHDYYPTSLNLRRPFEFERTVDMNTGIKDQMLYVASHTLTHKRHTKTERMPSWGGKVRFELLYEATIAGHTHEEVLDSFTVDVLRPLVILLNWDGVPRVRPPWASEPELWFHDILEGSSVLKEMTGYDGEITKGVELKDMYSIIPSDTYPTHATMYTGAPGEEHGMQSMGGFVDRDTLEYVQVAGAMSLVTAFKAESFLDRYLIDKGFEQDSFLSRLGREKFITLVAGNMYKLGNTKFQGPAETWLSSAALSGAKTSEADRNAYKNAVKDIKDDHSDLITIYMWNSDHGGHYYGMEYQRHYLVGDTTPIVGGDTASPIPQVTEDLNVEAYNKLLWDAIQQYGLERNALFILFDDHGRVKVGGEEFVLVPNIGSLSTLLEPYFVYERPELILCDVPGRGDSKFPCGYDAHLDESTLQFGADANLLQLYLRDGSSAFDWSVHPVFSDVIESTAIILRENDEPPDESLFKAQIAHVFATDYSNQDPTCGSNYCGVVLNGNTRLSHP